MCVYLSACLSVFFLSATRHLSTLRRCLRVAESRSRRGRRAAPARGGKRMHSESTCVPMLYNFSTKKSLRWCLSKTKPYARACCGIRNCGDFQKENQHATSQVQFTACLLLECLLSESYWIVFFTNRVCWPPWNHGEPGDLPSLRRRG